MALFGKCTPCHAQFTLLQKHSAYHSTSAFYVLLTEWDEQIHCPNMLHHTERVGLSYRINKVWELAAWSKGCTTQWRDISDLLLQQSTRIYRAKCQENSGTVVWACGGSSDGAVEHRGKVGYRPKRSLLLMSGLWGFKYKETQTALMNLKLHWM